MHNQNLNRQSSETVQIPLCLPFFNQSHTVSVNGSVNGFESSIEWVGNRSHMLGLNP